MKTQSGRTLWAFSVQRSGARTISRPASSMMSLLFAAGSVMMTGGLMRRMCPIVVRANAIRNTR